MTTVFGVLCTYIVYFCTYLRYDSAVHSHRSFPHMSHLCSALHSHSGFSLMSQLWQCLTLIQWFFAHVSAMGVPYTHIVVFRSCLSYGSTLTSWFSLISQLWLFFAHISAMRKTTITQWFFAHVSAAVVPYSHFVVFSHVLRVYEA